MQVHQARPPFVQFRQVPVEDRNATIEKGVRVTRDVNMAFIMQPGSKDEVEKIAEDWLAQIKHKALIGAPDAYPEEWISGFHKKFELWKEGIDAPVDGTSLRQVGFLSPAAIENYIAMRILTVEDLAAMTEVAMQNAGMGARADRDKARAFLQSVKDHGGATEKIAALEAQVQTQDQTIAELREVIGALQQQIEAAPAKRGPGRPSQAN